MGFPLQLALGVVGNVTSLALYLSPMATFWGIYKLKSTQEYSGLPYVCTLFSCSLWLLYGAPFVKPHSTLILTISGAGFALEIFYLSSFLKFASRKKQVETTRLTLAMTMAFAVIVAITIFVLHTNSARQLVAGTLCVILSIVMYASPLAIAGTVIRTKSVEYMPFLLSLFNVLNALVWCAYSLITRDIFIAVPNGVGLLLGVIQLIIYFVYRNSTPVLPTSTELPEAKKTNNKFDLPIQDVQLEKTNIAKVASVDPAIADQV